MKPIGPTFASELKAAGLLGLPFSWSENGEFFFSEDMTPDQIKAVQAVYDAHNPKLEQPIPQEIVAVSAIAAKADDDTPVTAAEIRQFMAAVSKQFGWIQ